MRISQIERFEELRNIRKYPMNMWTAEGYNDAEYRELHAMLSEAKQKLDLTIVDDLIFVLTGDCLDRVPHVIRILQAIKNI